MTTFRELLQGCSTAEMNAADLPSPFLLDQTRPGTPCARRSEKREGPIDVVRHRPRPCHIFLQLGRSLRLDQPDLARDAVGLEAHVEPGIATGEHEFLADVVHLEGPNQG